MSLNILSADILGLIFNTSHNSRHVLNLWKTGDRILQHKLSLSITFLDIRDSRLHSTSRYPKLISCFTKLSTLHVDRGNAWLMDTPAHLSRELAKLPPSLTSLSLSSRDAPSSLLNYGFSDAVVKNSYNRGGSDLCDLSQLFPSLQSLTIADFGGQSSIAYSDFAGLPSSLIRLHLPSIKEPRPFMQGKLPQSLTDVDIGLTSFEWNPTNSAFVLPHQTHLSLGKIDFLAFSTLGRCWTAALPQKLVALVLNFHQRLFESDIALLPQSITYLRAQIEMAKEREDEATPIAWPSSLQSLYLFCPTHLSCLPRTQQLHTLILNGIDDEAGFNAVRIPPNVTDLQLRNFGADLQSLKCLLLPPSLLKFYFNTSVQYSLRTDLPLSAFVNLPPSVTDLEAHCDLTAFPPHLTRLFMDEVLITAALPTCLTELSLYELNTHGYEDGDDEAYFEIFLRNLPMGLRSLHIHEAVGNEFFKTPSAWARLTCLETLAFGLKSIDVLPLIYRALPSSARHLRLADYSEACKGRSGKPYSAIFFNLPTHLQSLSLDKWYGLKIDALVTACTSDTLQLFVDGKEVASPAVIFRAQKYPDPRVLQS